MTLPQQTSHRWQALDIMKTIGLMGALMGHIVIWWYAENMDPSTSAYFKLSLAQFSPLIACLFILLIVHFLFITAGASFSFYLKKGPSMKNVLFRVILFIFLGVLFGLNIHPFFLVWDVFLLYAFSILIISLFNKYGSEKWLAITTLGVLITAPFLRSFLNNATPENYISAIFIGDPQGKISIYPIFPWFFMIGIGFLIGNFYSKHHNKKFLKYGIVGGIVAALAAMPFLIPLDPSNIFGATSQIPISYIVFIFSIFIFMISLLETIFKNKIFSKHNPIVAIGRNILPIYIITILITLPVTNALKNSHKYDGNNNTYIFIALEVATFIIACLSAVALSYGNRKSD